MAWGDLVDDALCERMVGIRRHLHAHPELGHHEVETTAYVTRALRDSGLRVRHPLPTGVVAEIGGGDDRPFVLRADIDALALREENDVPYASTIPGAMHACGHDGHMAVLLGVAQVLSRIASDLPGRVRLLFQPAEEVIDGGAKALIACGELRDVRAALGIHLWSPLSTGTIGIPHGAALASSDVFEAVIRGRGGHGAYPHQTVDPVVATAYAITALQTLVSRRRDPLSPAVVTVGTLRAGTAPNVIPDDATISGTFRAFSPEVREQLQREIPATIKAAAGTMGAQASVTIGLGNPPLINDARIAELVARTAGAAAGVTGVVDLAPSMGSEDFAYYAEVVPSAFIFVGSGSAARGSDRPHHSSRFDLDEAALGIGARVLLNGLESVMRSGAVA